MATNTHGSDAWKEQESASLAAAQEDPAVLSSLEWDLKLYGEVVLPLFEQQMVGAGLSI